MKSIAPLKLEEMTKDQKIGMVLMGTGGSPDFTQYPYALEKIARHELGTVWIINNQYGAQNHYREHIGKIHEIEDYPVMIIADMENGYEEFHNGRQISLGYIDDVDLTYRFARGVGARAREHGYTGICSPILDVSGIKTLMPTRSFGLDKYGILRHAEAYINGLHDGGVLAIVKHYPSVCSGVDTHLFEGHCTETEEQLIETNLFPYLELCKKGLIDGIMTSHTVVEGVDKENPATLSKKLLDIIKSRGFEGFIITDDMTMMGICAKYGLERYNKSVEAGADVLLEWTTKEAEAQVNKAIDAGTLSMERIEDAAKRLIRAQRKYLSLTPYKLTPEDLKVPDEVNRRSICALTDDGVSPEIPTGGRHLFVIMTEQGTDYSAAKDVTAIVDQGKWYKPLALSEHIKKRFPNSETMFVQEYPDRIQMSNIVHASLAYDDTVLVYFSQPLSYVGGESFTPRIINLAKSLVASNRAKTLVYYGNPNLLASLPRIPRTIAGCNEESNTRYCIDVLAGLIKAEGHLPYEVERKEM